MSDITIPFNYSGSCESMITRMKAVEQKMREQYSQQIQSINVQWNDRGCVADFKVSGFALKTTLTLVPNESAPNDGGTGTVALELPMVLSMFKGTIESRIQSEMKNLLGNG